MVTQYRCDKELRRELIRGINDREIAAGRAPLLNGVDYLEVLDTEAPDGSPRQRTLLVRLLADVPAGFSERRVTIEGGVRITPVKSEWAVAAPQIASVPGLAAEEADLVTYCGALAEPTKVLVVRADSSGDYSTYRLLLAPADTDVPPLDPQLTEVEFSFKVECASEFDCRAVTVCPPERLSEPVLDYLAKDHASFRRLMLDRLAVVMPAWEERNAADLGIALVELLAYMGDQLSYYQDAVATEAYLGTARRRASVRRHARLLDYRMHDGCNARAWAVMEVEASGGADGATLPGPGDGMPGTTLLTQTEAPLGGLHLDAAGLSEAVSAGAVVFETLHDVTLRAAHNELRFHTWGDERCCLPRGATRATLRRSGWDAGGEDWDGEVDLHPGDLLVLEEVRGPASGGLADADPSHRHVVRLTEVHYGVDPLDLANPGAPIPVVEVEWAADDALPFPLCLWDVDDPSHPGEAHPVSVARGNVVLADHGRTMAGEELPATAPGRPYRPQLKEGPITQQAWARTPLGQVARDDDGAPLLFDPAASASAALRWKMRDVLPAIWLADPARDDLWLPQRDLLGSDRFAAEFVVEVEDDGRASLRFGDGILGSRPVDGLTATYRVGNGQAGNVGAEAIAHVITPLSGIRGVRNPLPAKGGAGPEPAAQVRLYAPQAFRTQERAVTEADYAAVARRHPEVQKAAATRRWTGSWYTMSVTVDRTRGASVDTDFTTDLLRFLARFRLAGYDLEVEAPVFVPLEIVLTVCVTAGHFRSAVKLALLEAFCNHDLPDGRRGFFHPDNFTFGQPVYLSQVIVAAMDVPGVLWVDVDDTPPKPNRFRRWGEESRGELAEGRIDLGRLEIARLDNDPNRPENGKINFVMQGGL